MFGLDERIAASSDGASIRVVLAVAVLADHSFRG
jgi:hypothetical protein